MKYLSLILLVAASGLARGAEGPPTSFPENKPAPSAVEETLPEPVQILKSESTGAPAAKVAPATPEQPVASAPAETSTDVRIPSAVLPTDLNLLLERIRTCSSVWEQQPTTSRLPRSGDFEKMEKFKKTLRKNHCSNLSQSLISMREKYRDQPEVVHVCDKLITSPPDQYKALRK